MKIKKDLNSINENEFTAVFGSIFEKSEWIAAETFKQKPFENSQDLINKMIKIYESCSTEQIIIILNLHPKLAIEKKLTSFSTKEQTGAKLDRCSKEELEEFNQLNFDYEKKFQFPFIIAVKDKNKNEILDNFRNRISNNYEKEFHEAKIQVLKIALFRLNEVFEKINC
jgi:OHCU decarboxylase